VIQELAGGRLHLSHGPIDVVLRAWGRPGEVRAAYAAAAARFPALLPELCDELEELRRPMADGPVVGGPVARRMLEACRPFAEAFVTPMAAVAGAVADELLAHMTASARLERAFVNDGGDIAILVKPGHPLDIGVACEFSRGTIPAVSGAVRLDASCGIGGIATSGARGRSFSLGIADSVTALAGNAAAADVAATLIANAVDIDSPAISRRPARDLDPDSDLGELPVTVVVGTLSQGEIDTALTRGLERALDYRRRGLVKDAALSLQGAIRILAEAVQPAAAGLSGRRAADRGALPSGRSRPAARA
jgi:ApbE superfamily uncharacterized protein (UPF0280 family)